jgi:hypothetical protein
MLHCPMLVLCSTMVLCCIISMLYLSHFGDVKGVSGGVDVIMLSDQVLRIFQFQHREWLLTAPIFFLACSGKTALAASIGIDSGFPFIKIVRSVFPVPFVHCWGLGCLDYMRPPCRRCYCVFWLSLEFRLCLHVVFVGLPVYNENGKDAFFVLE